MSGPEDRYNPDALPPIARPDLSQAERQRLDKAIDDLYRGKDRQEELIDIICQCFYQDQLRKKS